MKKKQTSNPVKDCRQLELLRDLFQNFSTSWRLKENDFRGSLRNYLKNTSKNGHVLEDTEDLLRLSEVTEQHFNIYRERIHEIIAYMSLDEFCEKAQPFSPQEYFLQSRKELYLRLMEKRVQEQVSASEYEEMNATLKGCYDSKRKMATRTVNRHYNELLQTLFPSAVIAEQSDKSSKKNKNNNNNNNSSNYDNNLINSTGDDNDFHYSVDHLQSTQNNDTNERTSAKKDSVQPSHERTTEATLLSFEEFSSPSSSSVSCSTSSSSSCSKALVLSPPSSSSRHPL
jgi:hypothetical protein